MSKKALVLINGIEAEEHSVVQVEDATNIFEVHPNLQWIDCDDNVVAYDYIYNNITKTFHEHPTKIKQKEEAGIIDETTHRYVFDEVNNVWTSEALPTE